MTFRWLATEHGEHLESGFILLMEVEKSEYPSLTNLKHNFNDDDSRVRWRSKQVLDYAFMFSAAKDMSKFYLQIEDDVVSSQNLVAKIKEHINTKPEDWITLEFAKLGFIGKLYKSEDLERLSVFLIMFYMEQPVDWLYTYFSQLLAQNKRIIITPSLFQHFGLHSSFVENDKARKKRYNNLSERRFADPDPLDFAEIGSLHNNNNNREPIPIIEGGNPPAKRISTTIAVHSIYRPENAYLNNKFFWGKSPKLNDTFTVVFQNPTKMNFVLIITGAKHHPDDYLHAGIVEYNRNISSDARSCLEHTYIRLGTFHEGSFAMSLRGPKAIDDVQCLRIRVTATQQEWLVISTMSISSAPCLKYTMFVSVHTFTLLFIAFSKVFLESHKQ